jgi:hypothetical protein
VSLKPGWWSQPFAAEGGVAAEGIVKQLGTPSLDPLTVLVREAAQNSWDARTGTEDVDFRVSLRSLAGAASEWRRLLLPGPDERSLTLGEGLTAACPVLVVSDRGTGGLGGPLRADVRVVDGVRANFVQFMRNVGEPRDQRLGGGTYGFGKGIYYRLSRVRTILVHSRIRTSYGFEHRLMAASLGSSFYATDGKRFTGRHWWGVTAQDGVLDPVVGDDAASLAADLNLPAFTDGQTGTDIVVLDADLGVARSWEGQLVARDAREAATFVASSMLWNLWPKFIEAEGASARILFHVDIDGIDVDVPHPSAVDALAPYVEALEVIRAGSGKPYRRARPPLEGGRLGIALCGSGRGVEPSLISAARPYSGDPHHVARMRMAELVVDYRELAAHPNPALAYAAVFRASAEADELFASAEPPTHDDWNDKGLSGTAKGVVQGAWRFIKKETDAIIGPAQAPGGQAMSGLGALASRLATLVPATSAAGAGGLATKIPGGRSGAREGGWRTGRPGSASSRGGAVLAGPPWLSIIDDIPYVLGRVAVQASPQARRLVCEPAVVLEGGAPETERPAGAAVPRVLQWRNESSGESTPGESIKIAADFSGSLIVHCSHVPDAVVRLNVRYEDAS